MKPVIITLDANGRVLISSDEFKRYMDAAYNQGWSDANASVERTKVIENTTVGVTNVDGVANKTSISNYLRNKGE